MHAPFTAPERKKRIGGIACLVGIGSLLAVAAGEAQAETRLTASAAEGFECKASEALGLPAADAATAVSLVCQELARVSGRAGRYGVSLRPLGRSLILSVTALPGGDVRSLTLRNLDETPLAATRLAEALVLGKPVESTQRVDNLLAAETRQPREKKGSRKIVLGVVGLGVGGQGVGTGAGFSLGAAYEMPAWAVVAGLQYARGSRYEDWASLFALSAGGRRYLSRRNVAPYVGAGLERLSVSTWHRQPLGDRSMDGVSIAPYLEAGVQMMRFSRARVAAGVRVHLPTASLEGESWTWGDPDGSCDGCYDPAEAQHSSEYVVPVTFAMSVSF